MSGYIEREYVVVWECKIFDIKLWYASYDYTWKVQSKGEFVLTETCGVYAKRKVGDLILSGIISGGTKGIGNV